MEGEPIVGNDVWMPDILPTELHAPHDFSKQEVINKTLCLLPNASIIPKFMHGRSAGPASENIMLPFTEMVFLLSK